MVEIHTHQSRKGYRTYITYGRKIHVIDGNFTAEPDDVRTGQSATPYLYGT
ncbi:MAG TPA: hypothetical protein VFI84_01690 [Candidatus Saccharimonadales bacterium]|nr:hypothetical protein [Candidatus Saccharimonadales bacterium]